MRAVVLASCMFLVGCAAETGRETLSVRTGNVQCTERIIFSGGQGGRLGLAVTNTGDVTTGVNVSLPLDGASSVEGPTQRCEKARKIAEEAARVDLDIKRAELREALADAQLAEARVEAELLAIKAQNANIEGVDW